MSKEKPSMNPRLQQPAANTGPTPAELLAKMPRRPMTLEQQQAALEKVQQQATQSVKLGQQLFEAADARLKQHQQVLDEINQQQQKLREQVQEDVAKSLQTYDQWMGKIDESFTTAIRELNQRIDGLELKVDSSRGEMEAMIEKAAALLNQTQELLAEVFEEEVTSEADEVAKAMQQSVPKDQQCDLDHMPKPPIDEDSFYDDDSAEVIEVEILSDQDSRDDMEDSFGQDVTPADENDVFGQVLKRLRSQREDDNAAA